MLRVNRASLNSISQLGKRKFSKRTTIPSERNWDPKEIYPSGPGEVNSPKQTFCFQVKRHANQAKSIPIIKSWNLILMVSFSSFRSSFEVRINGNTIRDGSQSLNGGQHRIDLLVEAASLIDAIRPADMKYPGCYVVFCLMLKQKKKSRFLFFLLVEKDEARNSQTLKRTF